MKIIYYSDLHLEFEHAWCMPEDVEGDILILAGDIINFSNYQPLKKLLSNWDKPVFFIPGNHEYYTQVPIHYEHQKFRQWLSAELPQVLFLTDEEASINGLHFFGGTMWTDFAEGNALAMNHAQSTMNDYQLIYQEDGKKITPEKTIELHQSFLNKLTRWFEKDLKGARIVLTHHAPVINPASQHNGSQLIPAFNSLDMIEIIEKYQPDYWIYGHTHECGEQVIGKTKIVSNQLGYPNGLGRYECLDFDSYGKIFEILKS